MSVHDSVSLTPNACPWRHRVQTILRMTGTRRFPLVKWMGADDGEKPGKMGQKVYDKQGRNEGVSENVLWDIFRRAHHTGQPGAEYARLARRLSILRGDAGRLPRPPR